VGKTIVTFLPIIEKPLSVSGNLWSFTRKGEIAAKSPSLFRDAREYSREVFVNIAGHVQFVIGTKGAFINQLQDTYKVTVTIKDDCAIITGDGDIVGVIVAILKRVKRNFSLVNISGYEGLVIGRDGKVIKDIKEKFNVQMHIVNGQAIISRDGDIAGAVLAVEEIVNIKREQAEKHATRTKRKLASAMIARWWRSIRTREDIVARSIAARAALNATKKLKKPKKKRASSKAVATSTSSETMASASASSKTAASASASSETTAPLRSSEATASSPEEVTLSTETKKNGKKTKKTIASAASAKKAARKAAQKSATDLSAVSSSLATSDGKGE
jgi:hypothetical protein